MFLLVGDLLGWKVVKGLESSWKIVVCVRRFIVVCES